MCFIRIRFFSFEFWIIGNGQDTFSPPKSEWAGLDWAFSWGPYLVCFQTLFLAWHGDLMWIIKNNSQHLLTLPSVPPFGSSVCCLCFTWMNISHTGNKFGDFWFYLRDEGWYIWQTSKMDDTVCSAEFALYAYMSVSTQGTSTVNKTCWENVLFIFIFPV